MAWGVAMYMQSARGPDSLAVLKRERRVVVGEAHRVQRPPSSVSRSASAAAKSAISACTSCICSWI